MAEVLWLDGSAGIALENQSKDLGFKSQSKFSDFGYSPLPGVMLTSGYFVYNFFSYGMA